MKIPARLMTALGIMILAGCATSAPGIPAYRPVDLTHDLDAQAIVRYQKEADRIRESGGNCHMATLEATNWWPLSLVAYWRRGSVMTMPGNDGQLYYMVSQTRGYGPLSLIYLSQEDAAFDTQGKRLTHMTGRAVMMGCLAMSHEMESRLDPDTWMTHKTLHLIHHLINISDMDGMTNVSLFTAPNPIGYGH